MAVPVVVNSGAGSASAGTSGVFNFNAFYPATPVAGNLLVLHILTRIGAGGTAYIDSVPAGWNLLFEDTATPSLTVRQALWYRYATGSESGSIALAGEYFGGAGQGAYARIIQISGVLASGTINESGGVTSGSGTAVSYVATTTTGVDELAVIFAGYSNAGTMADVAGETGGNFTQPFARYASITGGDGSISVQSAGMSAAGTISGGSATIGTSGSWITRSFAFLSVAAATDACVNVWYDAANETAQLHHNDLLVEPYREDMSVDAVPVDFPEDPIAGVIVWDSSELVDPSMTDFDDWSWAQAPPLDDLPTDVLLGIYDATEFEDPSQTDLTDYSSYTPPVVPDLPEDGLLASIEDASQYEDPSFTDQTDYSSYSEIVPDDALEPLGFVWDDTNSFEDPSQTDESDYGSQSDPLGDDEPDDGLMGHVDDGTNLEDPSQTDLEDYSTYSPPLGPDAPDDPVADVLVWDSVEFEDPSQTDLTEYGWVVAPLSADAPPDFPIDALVEDGDKFESPQDDWDYGTAVDPLPLNVIPTPPVVPLASPCLRLYENGPPGVSACNLNTFEQTCNTIEELRGLIGTPGLQVSVRGAQVVGDAGAGVFIWSATQVGGDDGSNIVFPLAGGDEGAWIRIGFWSRDSKFVPLSNAPEPRSDGGFIYVSSDGTLRYRGPNTDSTIAPP